MDWAFFSKWTGLKLSFGFRKNRQQPKQGGKKMANFGIFAEKTWRRRIEGGISEKQGEKNLLRKFWNFRRKNLEKKN